MPRSHWRTFTWKGGRCSPLGRSVSRSHQLQPSRHGGEEMHVETRRQAPQQLLGSAQTRTRYTTRADQCLWRRVPLDMWYVRRSEAPSKPHAPHRPGAEASRRGGPNRLAVGIRLHRRRTSMSRRIPHSAELKGWICLAKEPAISQNGKQVIHEGGCGPRNTPHAPFCSTTPNALSDRRPLTFSTSSVP
jgi:hypothetical protein